MFSVEKGLEQSQKARFRHPPSWQNKYVPGTAVAHDPVACPHSHPTKDRAAKPTRNAYRLLQASSDLPSLLYTHTESPRLIVADGCGTDFYRPLWGVN